MNYCPACRRHLNGALACAGCGTPAEYLIPAAPAGPAAAPAAEPVPTALADVYADSLVVLSGPERGRAGARRRSGRRRRRRTVLTVGLGLVLATGASVAMARMATDGGSSDRAARVELTDNAGPTAPAPLPSLEGAPAAPSALPPGKGSATAKATAGAAKTAGPGRATGGPGTPGVTPPASAPGAPGPTRSAPGTGGTVKPTAPGQPAPSGSGTAQPTASASPTPTASPTCRFFWPFC
ncbi:SCO2400 family protein [Streptomyces sp. NBC_00503]|uniref:SCO2400 family protein n=1 Tax=Streptomyces sp. NBC_00503 TaxID=2903659 RepID=UPI002E80041C|nr:hypothetical protein [Streptomyces sp. NBC_00503]WUD81198.1 hypothetical protein OG490_11970 [Streptomyces sp. NBC_00503]